MLLVMLGAGLRVSEISMNRSSGIEATACHLDESLGLIPIDTRVLSIGHLEMGDLLASVPALPTAAP